MAIFKKLKWFSFCVFVCTLLMPNDSSVWAKEECNANKNSEDCNGSSDSNEEGWDISSCQLLKYGGVLAGAAGGIAAAPAILAAMGFTAGGVTAGTLAAKMVAFYGGAVPAGSLVAYLQSAGAAGLGLASKGVIGTLAGYLTSWLPICEDINIDAAVLKEFTLDDLCKFWNPVKVLQRKGQDENKESGGEDIFTAAFGFKRKEDATKGYGFFSHFASLTPDQKDHLCTAWKGINGQL